MTHSSLEYGDQKIKRSKTFNFDFGHLATFPSAYVDKDCQTTCPVTQLEILSEAINMIEIDDDISTAEEIDQKLFYSAKKLVLLMCRETEDLVFILDILLDSSIRSKNIYFANFTFKALLFLIQNMPEVATSFLQNTHNEELDPQFANRINNLMRKFGLYSVVDPLSSKDGVLHNAIIFVRKFSCNSSHMVAPSLRCIRKILSCIHSTIESMNYTISLLLEPDGLGIHSSFYFGNFDVKLVCLDIIILLLSYGTPFSS